MMVKKKYPIGLLCLFSLCWLIFYPAHVNAQSTWARTYGLDGAYANSIKQTSDGGYIVAGESPYPNSGNYSDILILKLNASGNVVWQKTYGGLYFDTANSIQQTSDGGYIVAGNTQSSAAGTYDFWILKLDASGNVVWQKAFGGSNDDFAQSIQQTSDGGYIVAGTTYSFGTGWDIWILKLDASGNVVWQNTYSEYGAWGNAIQQTGDGGYVVAGTAYSMDTSSFDFWILKLDASGNVVWQKSYGGTDDDYARSIQQTSDGGYIIAGDTTPSGTYYIVKLDSSGNISWQKIYGDTNDNHVRYIQQTSNGGYIVAGYKYYSDEDYTNDAWIMKLDASGNVTWQKTYGGSNDDFAQSIQQTSDGGYIVAGSTSSFGTGNSNIWVLKLKADGTMDSSCSFIQNTSIIPVASSAASADTNATISSTVSTITNTAITGIDSGAPETIICSSCSLPAGLANNTAADPEQCANAGIHIGWNANPVNWNDNGTGTRTYDMLRDGVILATGLLYGTTTYLDTTGTHGQIYTYKVRYVNGCGSQAETAGANQADFPKPPTVMNTIAQDRSPQSTGIDISWPLPADWGDQGINTSERGFRIYRDSTDISGLLPASVLTIEDTGGIINTYYTYHTEAINGCGVATAYNGISAVDVVTQVKDWSRLYYAPGYVENAKDIQQTSDEGFIIAGDGPQLSNSSSPDYWIIKLNSSGNVAWQKTYGGTQDDNAQSIQQTSDGGYIVAGYSGSFDNIGTWILKLDSSGNIEWQKIYQSAPVTNSIQQTSDGGYIFAGNNTAIGVGSDFWVVKLDASGNIVWQKTYDNGAYEEAKSIQQTSDGGYIVAGYFESFDPEKSDAWILKLDAAGNVIWQKIYRGFQQFNSAQSIKQTSDGGYIVAAQTGYYNADYDILIIKLDPSGNVIWQYTYGEYGDSRVNSIQQTSDGGYVVAGYSNTFGESMDAWIFKLDAAGNVIWQKTYGGLNYVSDYDIATSIQQTSDGGYIVVGNSCSFLEGLCGLWVLKLNPYGTMNSSCDFVHDTNVTPRNLTFYSADTNAIVDSVSPVTNDTSIIGTDSNASELLLCNSDLFLRPYHNEKPLVIDAGSPTENGIIEPNEMVKLESTLENTGIMTATSVTGSLTTNDPIAIHSADARYPDILPNEHSTCTGCYSLYAPLAGRPGTHWDFEVIENVTATNFGPRPFFYKYHVGSSFSDVPPSNLFYPYIEKLLHTGITGGCTSTTYCPSSFVEREQMAKFLCTSMHKLLPYSCYPTSNYCSGIFNDVPSSNIFCSFIEQLYYDGIVSGCQSAPLLYCPTTATRRQAMAKFICLSMDSANPGSCSIESCNGIFTDVPAANPFCSYIEALYNSGIISGCAPNTFCPAADVSRGQMSKFLVNAFSLTL